MARTSNRLLFGGVAQHHMVICLLPVKPGKYSLLIFVLIETMKLLHVQDIFLSYNFRLQYINHLAEFSLNL